MERVDLAGLLARVPFGWTRVEVNGRPYGLTRRDRAGGQVITLWAESLSGTEVISANVWRTRDGLVLRPCEMPAASVIDFLTAFRVATSSAPEADEEIDDKTAGHDRQ